MQVPQGAESAGPADQALYDAVAKALLGERPSAQPAEPGEQLPGREQLRRVLHYLLGTQLRRHLEKCAALSICQNTHHWGSQKPSWCR